MKDFFKNVGAEFINENGNGEEQEILEKKKKKENKFRSKTLIK